MVDGFLDSALFQIGISLNMWKVNINTQNGKSLQPDVVVFNVEVATLDGINADDAVVDTGDSVGFPRESEIDHGMKLNI